MKPVDAFAQPGKFFKGNLHTHSTCSDGKYSAQEVCAKYQAAGYDFLALSDHFLPRFDFPVSDTRPWRSDTFTTLLSAELHVPATALKESWHILAVGLPLDFQKPRPSETAAQISRRAHAAGAFVGIVHPSWYGLTLEEVEAIDCAHAVEIYNHTGTVKHDRGDSCAFFDQLLSRGRRLNAFAADDAHFHHDDAFAAWVMVKSTALAQDDLVEALKQGHFYSSQGPEITSIAIDDEFIEIECSAAKAVMVLGRGSTAESELGSRLTRVKLPLAQLRKAGYGRVVVVAQDGKRAWSNPIWFVPGGR